MAGAPRTFPAFLLCTCQARGAGRGRAGRAPCRCGTSAGPLPGRVSLGELLNLSIFSFLTGQTEITLTLTSKGSWED